MNLVESTSAPHSVPANIPENHVVANYISAQGATMAVDRIAAVAHKVAVAKSSVRSARNVATKPQRVTAGPLWLRLATLDPHTLSLDHHFLGHPSLRLVCTASTQFCTTQLWCSAIFRHHAATTLC